MHKLLERQLMRQFGSLDKVPENLKSFLQAVGESYGAEEEDRRLLERSLEISSRELLQFYETLRSEKERYRLMVETATEGMGSVNRQGRTTFMNSVMAAMLGVPREEAVGRSVFDFIAPEDRAPAQATLDRLLAGESVRLDFRFRRADGRPLWVLASGAPVRAPDDQVLGVLGMVTDITERKRAEELKTALTRLQEVDRVRAHFLNTAAHELGTPLTPIMLQVRLVRNQLGSARLASGRNFDILERNLDRLGRLVKDLLDSSRLQTGHLRIVRRRLDLGELVAEAVDAFQSSAAASGIVLHMEAPPELPVECDPDRVLQVFDNLLGNALKFTRPGGRVDVRLRALGTDAVVDVQDIGAGFPPAAHAKLFLPFSQVHDTMQQTQAGTGLGLYISRGIVEAHGGMLDGRSDGPGLGAAFTVRLPLVAVTDTRSGMAQQEPSTAPPAHA